MVETIETLTPSGAEMFKVARQCLLPNEEVHLVCEIQNGFFVLTSRRTVLLEKNRKQAYRISKVIPYDCIRGVEPKKDDRVLISGIALDQYGCHTTETSSFEVKAPRGESGQTKQDIRDHFQSTMRLCLDIIEDIRTGESFTEEKPIMRGLSYLERMPASLTYNAVLDLNTVLRDRPIHDMLVREAEKFLGSEPFLLEESLRDGNDIENGVLFAAGKNGYYWVQGKKLGRFMSGVVIDTVEWRNIRCFAHQWQNDGAVINAIYSVTQDGPVSTQLYQWKPLLTEDMSDYPWLLQPLNGPWILSDIAYKCSGFSLPASWTHEMQSRHSTPYCKRFYL